MADTSARTCTHRVGSCVGVWEVCGAAVVGALAEQCVWVWKCSGDVWDGRTSDMSISPSRTISITAFRSSSPRAVTSASDTVSILRRDMLT